MKNLAVENALRWVLAAWTLGVSVFAPTTVVHRHFGGQSPHEHSCFDPAPEATLYSCEPVDLCKGLEFTAFSLPTDLHKHPGFLLLGTVKHVPMPGESNGPDGKSPGGWETISTALSSRCLRVSATSSWADDFELAPVADFCAGCASIREHHEVSTSSDVRCSQLCDRARHERSGVQLA